MHPPPDGEDDPYQLERRYSVLAEQFERAYLQRFRASPEEAQLAQARMMESSALIRRAYEFARDAHAVHSRADGSPYITHPLEVARIAASVMPDPHAVSASLLHDTVEDCDDVSSERIEREFGPTVRRIVDGVTKLEKTMFPDRLTASAANFHRLFDLSSEDFRVIVVKLADRLHNTRTLGATSVEKQLRIAIETKDFYAGVARLIGMTSLADELDEITTKIIDPAGYAAMQKLVHDIELAKAAASETFLRTLENLLADLDISGRVIQVRSPVSRLLRIVRAREAASPQPGEVFAFAVVTEDLPTFNALIGRIASQWPALPGYRNYQDSPGEQGQRYIEMHVLDNALGETCVRIWPLSEWERAGGGLANFWDYRRGILNEEYADTARLRMAALAEAVRKQSRVRSTHESLSQLRTELSKESLRVLTRDGDPVELTSGSTALDFAFTLHQDVGVTARGARVNGVDVSLGTRLREGDRVEILRESRPVIQPGWLAWVTIPTVKKTIRRWFARHQSSDKRLEMGMLLLDHELASWGITSAELFADPNRRRRLRSKGWEDAESIARALVVGQTSPRAISETAFARRGAKNRARQTSLSVEAITGAPVEVRLARCCNPLPGVEAYAFMALGGRLMVHRANCVALEMYSGRLGAPIPFAWPEPANDEARGYRTRITVYTQDRKGILSRLADLFSRHHSNILKATCEARASGPAVNLFEVTVRDEAQVQTMLAELRRLDGVLSAERELLLVPA